MYRISDLMTKQVVYLSADTPLDEAAKAMQDADIGDVVVTDGSSIIGMVTDRDIVVRAVAERKNPTSTSLGSIITREVVMIEQSSTAAEAAALMRDRGVRRILVCDADRRLVGIVSLGDLAMRMDASSTLEEISEQPPDA
ncbi:CBS domain-containing protein [Plantactinospora sp. KBS50]|uniref:CBS domain-containing protein n=1 Tax=Plantactinospora sp. KBS50 TaxID=2024580 RepID=UPI000BAAE61E|nr:CBS domain-containing protein [Plantactinospora sp. KBS50]ASW52962.1 signal transduction protein [Plantactinospora sp. KBS50]